MQRLRVSPKWRLSQKGRVLYISGGQDALYTIELDSESPSFFSQPTAQFTHEVLSREDALVCEQLIAADIVHPVLSFQGSRPVISVIGDSESLNIFSDSEIFQQSRSDEPEFIVLVRASSTFQQFLEHVRYSEITQPHLFVDLAYHHTISIGPMVFPGSTSCVTCLATRITSRWEHDVPPTQPQSAKIDVVLAREWVLREITKILDENYLLVNKTISFDTQSTTLTHNTLLTVPTCTYCNKKYMYDADGKVDLTQDKANI